MIGSFWFNSFSAGGAPAGGTDYELISTTVLGSSAASVTFSSLDTLAASYKHLQLRMTMRGQYASDPESYFWMRINGVTTNSYAAHYLQGNGSSVSSGALTNMAGMWFGWGTNNASTSKYGAAVVDILDFSQTTKNKTIRSLTGEIGASNSIALHSGFFNSTAAVTSVTVYQPKANIESGSRFSLYGLRG